MNWLLIQPKMSYLLEQYCSCRIDNRLMHVFTQLAVRAEEAEEKNRKLKREVCPILFWACTTAFSGTS